MTRLFKILPVYDHLDPPVSIGVLRLPDGSMLLVPDHLEEAYYARDEKALKELIRAVLGSEFEFVRLEGV